MQGGIGAATHGLAHLTVVRPTAATVDLSLQEWITHDAEFMMVFVLYGGVVFHTFEQGEVNLLPGDSVVVPAGLAHGFSSCTVDLQMLDVTLPKVEGADVSITRHPAEQTATPQGRL